MAETSQPPPSVIRLTSQKRASLGYASGRSGLHFRDPFDESMMAIRMSYAECETFATGFAKSTQSLENLHVDLGKVLETRHTGSAEGKGTIKAHRSALCRAVAILTKQSHMSRILCDYSGVRKIPYGRSEPLKYTLSSSKSTSVPLQRIHIGPLTIPRDTASLIFEEVKPLLHKLNDVLRTEYALDRPGLQACLQGYLDESCDFGQIYGYLRPWWFRGNFDRISALMQQRKEEDALLRKNAVDGDCIINPHVPPRRIWDLYSNRVLPFYVLPVPSPSIIPGNVWAVSHSW